MYNRKSHNRPCIKFLGSCQQFNRRVFYYGGLCKKKLFGPEGFFCSCIVVCCEQHSVSYTWHRDRDFLLRSPNNSEIYFVLYSKVCWGHEGLHCLVKSELQTQIAMKGFFFLFSLVLIQRSTSDLFSCSVIIYCYFISSSSPWADFKHISPKPLN